MTLIDDVFPEIPARKNMVSGKCIETLLQSERAAPLQYLLITVKVVALEKLCFSNTQNPKTVC